MTFMENKSEGVPVEAAMVTHKVSDNVQEQKEEENSIRQIMTFEILQKRLPNLFLQKKNQDLRQRLNGNRAFSAWPFLVIAAKV